MGTQWAEAGWGRRTVFVIASVYWVAMLGLAVLSLPLARSAQEIILFLGFYLVPLLYALIIRLAFVALSSRRPRPRIRSWWVTSSVHCSASSSPWPESRSRWRDRSQRSFTRGL